MEWTRPEITELITLYRQYECLWNNTHHNYNNFETKQNAWLDISHACGREVVDCKRKVKNLRSAYVLEKKKSEAYKDRGVTYKPNLFYYNDMDFLENVVILRKSTLPSSVKPTFQEKANVERKHKTVKVDRKIVRDLKFNNAIDSIVASVQQKSVQSVSGVEEDDCNNVFSSFGKTTALQLQQLPFGKATEAMAAIYQLVAKKTLDSLKTSPNAVHTKRKNGVTSF